MGLELSRQLPALYAKAKRVLPADKALWKGDHPALTQCTEPPAPMGGLDGEDMSPAYLGGLSLQHWIQGRTLQWLKGSSR